MKNLIKCRLPQVLECVKHLTGEEVTCMVKHYICANFYHHSCMNITVEDVKKIKSTKEMWSCDYKGCNAAVGNLFDLDSNQLLIPYQLANMNCIVAS